MPKSVRGERRADTEMRLHGARACNVCKQNKRAERFYPSNPYTCKVCVRTATKEHRREHPEIWTSYQRRHTLKRLYGLTPEQYEDMLRKQLGRCAICFTPHVRRRGVNNFAIDHDHSTGRIRGLLCHNCNRGLGHFQDSVALLLNAMEYLGQQEAVKSA